MATRGRSVGLGGRIPERPEPMSEEEIREAADGLLEEALDNIKTSEGRDREKCWRLFHGEVKQKAEEGGSDIVATACQDTVYAIVPGIMEALVSVDTIMEYVTTSTDKAEKQLVKRSTVRAHEVFWSSEAGGWVALHDALFEGAVSGSGWLKVHHKKRRNLETQELPFFDEEVQQARESGRVLRGTDKTMPMPSVIDPATKQPIEMPVYEVDGWKESAYPCIEAVPAVDVVHTDDKSPDDCALIGYKFDTRMGNLVSMGFDIHRLGDIELEDETYQSQERRARDQSNRSQIHMRNRQRKTKVWALRPVTVWELYVMMDVDGDGALERYIVHLAGNSRKLLSWQKIKRQPFVKIPLRRIPHGMFTKSIVSAVESNQEAETAALRGVVNNSNDVNSPMVMGPSSIDPDSITRWRKFKFIENNAGAGSAQFFSPPPVVGELIQAKQALEMAREEKVGVSRNTAALDVNSLASVSTAAVQGAQDAALVKREFMARLVAEIGLKAVFEKLLEIFREMPEVASPTGNGAPIPGDQFGEWKTRVRVGLGTGTRMERERVLTTMFGVHERLAQHIGQDNDYFDETHTANIVDDWGGLFAGMDGSRYFRTPEEVMQRKQQKAQQPPAPPPPDPKLLDVQRKTQDDQRKSELAGQKIHGDQILKAREQNLKDARDRDEVRMEAVLTAAELAQKDARDRAHINLKRPE